MRRLLRLATLLCLLCAISVVPAAAGTILIFGQVGGANAFTGNETAGVTVLDANNVPITITTLNSAGANLSAFFNLDATSVGIATNVGGSAWTQPYSGNFTITSGMNGTGFNFLSGLFTGTQLGLVGGHTLVLGSSQPPLTLSLTSSVAGMPLTDPSMALALTNVLPGVSIVNNSFADFDSNVAGTYSAQPIPEPLSLSLFGLTLFAGGWRLRKR